MRPSHWTALCPARRAAAEAAAAVAAEQRAAAAEQHRQIRAAATEQCRQDRRHNSSANVRYKGKVQLPPFRRYSPYWTGLLRGNNNAGKHFRSFGRRCNQVLSMASTGADIDTSLFDGHGPPTFHIKGKIRHLIGSLLPVTRQVLNSVKYIHQSADAQLDTRMTVYSSVNHVMLRELQSILHSMNPFVQQFKSAGEATASGNELELIIRADIGDVDRRRYNLPNAAGEVAALLPGEPIAAPQDIVIQHRSNQLQRIAESNAAYDPLHFPLMFPHGETGWHLQIAHSQNPTPNPDLVSAQQQQLEEFSSLQHEMRAEQQQQQPRANQPSALQIAKQQMHHLRELHPSQLEQQHDSGSKNRHEPESESDDGLNDGRGREDRCVAADFAICRYATTAILQALAFQRLNLWRLQNSEDEDNGDADFERREARSRSVTAMQFAAYRLHERAFESNDFLRWGFLFQVIPALSM